MKNKRGDIPVTILVIGIVGLCALAILSFYMSERNVRDGFEALELIEEIGLEAEKIMLYEKLEAEYGDIIDIKDPTGERYLLIEHDRVWVRYNLP
jgi:hypothetical protein